MAVKVEAGSLVKDSWEYFSKNIGKLWQIAVLLAAPGILSALFAKPKTITAEQAQSFNDLGGLSEAAFGVSLATAGLMAIVFVIAAVLYSAIVYGGAVKTMIKALRDSHGDISFSGVFNTGTKTFGSVILLTIVAGLIVGVGIILLVIPGLIAAFLLAFSLHYMVDKGMGVGESMSASFHTVKDNVGPVFMVWLVVAVITILISLVTAPILGSSSASVMRALNALFTGFVSTFTLIVATKLYLALSGRSHSASASAE